MIRMLHQSLRLQLDLVIKNEEFEKIVLENIRRCHRLNRQWFKVVFLNKDVSENKVKDFIKRNEHLLFEIDTQITKKFEPCWFLIDEQEEDKCKTRYRWGGDILSGIPMYLKMVKHINKRDKE